MAKLTQKISSYYFSFIALEFCKYVKISFALASGGILFSPTQMLMPVIGLYKDKQFNIIVYIGRTLLRMLWLGFSPLTFLYHLPTFCGNAYLAHQSRYAKMTIPVLCMIMFIAHPIGNQAFVYSMYWLIPITVAFLNPKSIFLQALGSTFTVHAVGSVIWLYTKQIDPTVWHMLIPVVLIERLMLAILTTLAFHLAKRIEQYIKAKKQKMMMPVIEALISE